uniref:Uncharacterized protein n=1 Tax=Romanomermis culicivorax TaxID=13658 RepID=A0A915JR47_ROMCU
MILDLIPMDQKMNNSKKLEKIHQFCHKVLNLPKDWVKNLKIQWIGYYESKSPGNWVNIKVDLMRLEDKETILANGKNLAEQNKSQKLPIIVGPDLTKE